MKPLTQEEVNALPDETPILVRWSGGNSGMYVLVHDKYGTPHAYTNTISGQRIHVGFLTDIHTNPLLDNASLIE